MSPPKQFLTSSAGRLLSFRALSAHCVISETGAVHVPVLVRHVIGGDFLDYMYILQDFGEDGVSRLSKEDLNTLATSEEEASIGVDLRAWSVVKLE